MPLVVISGIPSSGKTKIAEKLKHYLETFHKKTVDIVSEEAEAQKAGFHKETLYLESQQEKHLRSCLKSQVAKLINNENVVILDAGNYIKGYRYELYCTSKSVKSTQCTVYAMVNIQSAKSQTTLPPDIFDALVLRFEEPIGSNRWDSPLIVWMEDSDDQEMLKQVYSALYERNAPPQNLSTQNAPLSDSKFLQRLDEVTKDVCERATAGLLPGFPSDPSPSPAQLSRLRRQFITYSKMNLSNTPHQDIAKLFTQYLVTSLGEE